MKITVSVTLPYDNEIQFFDACKAAADKLIEMANEAISEGDIDRFSGVKHELFAAGDPEEQIGYVKCSKA